MNVAYYSLVFDQACEALITSVGMGEAYTRETNYSWMILETHTIFKHEAVVDDRLIVRSQLLGVDSKRVHLFQTMENDKNLDLSSNELIILHVDLQQRRSAPFPQSVMRRLSLLRSQHESLQLPPESGRKIGMKNSKPVKRDANPHD